MRIEVSSNQVTRAETIVGFHIIRSDDINIAGSSSVRYFFLYTSAGSNTRSPTVSTLPLWRSILRKKQD